MEHQICQKYVRRAMMFGTAMIFVASRWTELAAFEFIKPNVTKNGRVIFEIPPDFINFSRGYSEKALCNYGPENQTDFIIKLRHDNRTMMSDEVQKVMTMVDRQFFFDYNPYDDVSLFGLTGIIDSAPSLHVFILETLKGHLKEGARALDVGFGSGYLISCMAIMVGKTGSVVGIENKQKMVDSARNSTMTDPNAKLICDRLKLLCGNVSTVATKEGPFDAINVSPSTYNVPEALLEQLKPGGRMLIPVGEVGYFKRMRVYDKDINGHISVTNKTARLYAHRILW